MAKNGDIEYIVTPGGHKRYDVSGYIYLNKINQKQFYMDECPVENRKMI